MRNKKAVIVQEPAMVKPSRAKNRTPKPRWKRDRRVVRTRDKLGDALVALLHEKHFEEITVQDVLDRAGVGRSTFYAHYRDKQDLFLSDVEDFLEWVSTALNRQNAAPKRLLPVREFFEHIRQMREFHAALSKSGKLDDVLALARGFFARSIEERLTLARLQMTPERRSAQAHALAGSLCSLLDWWIAKGMKTDPQKIDELFHHIAWRGLG